MLSNQIIKEEVLLVNSVLNHFNSFPTHLYTNTEEKTQCTVSIIFRFNPQIFKKENKSFYSPTYDISEELDGFLNLVKINSDIQLTDNPISSGLEFLLVRRAVNPKDVHSGQVSFPGGKCEKDEDDFRAAIREAQEEVGLNLKDSKHYAYLGRFPKNFTGYFFKNEMRYITVHMFLHMSLHDTPIATSQGEIDEGFWLPLRYFLNPNVKESLKEESCPVGYATLFPPGKVYSPFVDLCMKGVDHVQFYHFVLPNKTTLWGFSAMITIYFLRNILKAINVYPEGYKTIDKEGFEQLMDKAISFHCVTKNGSRLEMRRRIFEWMYYKLRLEQFDEKTQLDLKFYALVVLLIVGPIAVNGLPKL